MDSLTSWMDKRIGNGEDNPFNIIKKWAIKEMHKKWSLTTKNGLQCLTNKIEMKTLHFCCKHNLLLDLFSFCIVWFGVIVWEKMFDLDVPNEREWANECGR